MSLPIVDFAGVEQDEHRLQAAARGLQEALSSEGFMLVTNIGVDEQLLADVFAASRAFFAQSEQDKARCAYRSAQENFGYQGTGQENLDPTAPADLKQTFTMRNLLHRPMPEQRWPDVQFARLMQDFYQQGLAAAHRMQRVMACALSIEAEFFPRCHGGENVSLRLLHYPAAAAAAASANQLGAGAHTDYGLLTLLFQDQVGGLQVRNRDGQWMDVTPVAGQVVVNSGDLLERWTNGRYRSTLHRVQPCQGSVSRQSIALFVDPDSDTLVAPLASCVDADHPVRFDPITAGEHVQQKLSASHKDRFSV